MKKKKQKVLFFWIRVILASLLCAMSIVGSGLQIMAEDNFYTGEPEEAATRGFIENQIVGSYEQTQIPEDYTLTYYDESRQIGIEVRCPADAFSTEDHPTLKVDQIEPSIADHLIRQAFPDSGESGDRVFYTISFLAGEYSVEPERSVQLSFLPYGMPAERQNRLVTLRMEKDADGYLSERSGLTIIPGKEELESRQVVLDAQTEYSEFVIQDLWLERIRLQLTRSGTIGFYEREDAAEEPANAEEFLEPGMIFNPEIPLTEDPANTTDNIIEETTSTEELPAAEELPSVESEIPPEEAPFTEENPDQFVDGEAPAEESPEVMEEQDSSITEVSDPEIAEEAASDSSDFVAEEEQGAFAEADPEHRNPVVGFMTAQTGRFSVRVEFGEEALIPADAVLRVKEFAEDSPEFLEHQAKTEQEIEWLLDVGFYIPKRTEKTKENLMVEDLMIEDQMMENTIFTDQILQDLLMDTPIAENQITEDSITEEQTAEYQTENLNAEAQMQMAAEEDWIEIEPAAPVRLFIEIEDMYQGDEVELIHFAEEGEEFYSTEETNVEVNEEGVGEIHVELTSFSLIAGKTYHKATVIGSEGFEAGQRYLIYRGSSNYLNMVNGTATGNFLGITVKAAADLECTGAYYNVGDTLYWQGNTLQNEIWVAEWVYLSGVGWTTCLRKEGTNYYLNANGNDYNNRRIYLSSNKMQVTYDGKNVVIGSGQYRYLSTTTYSSSNTRPAMSLSSSGNSFSVAKIGADYTARTQGNNYPPAVYTGTVQFNNMYFYNVAISPNGTLMGLPDVEYTIYRNGQPYTSIRTTDDIKVFVEDLKLPVGNYTMKMTSVPDGYILNPETWDFQIFQGQNLLQFKEESTGDLTGVIFHNTEPNEVINDKTAEVYDYANREYAIDLSAKATLRKYHLERLNLTLVLDQSNSMLFPASLEPIGNTKLIVDSNGYADYSQLQALRGNTVQNELYYAIADPEKSSTVFAIWYDGKQWRYQDASYYAKAYWRNYRNDTTHIQTDNIIPFPGLEAYDRDAHGGCLEVKLGGSLGAAGTYQIYRAGGTGDYNRLHYLKESTTRLIQALAALNPYIKVTVDTFTQTPQKCNTRTLLTQAEINSLLGTIGDITTTDGTRQDLALSHAHQLGHDRSNPSEYDENYMILITDGAPVSSDSGIEVGEFSTVVNDSGTLYQRINAQAQTVRGTANGGPRSECKLITIGLGMENVNSGKRSLKYISTNGQRQSVYESSGEYGDYWFQPKNSSMLVDILERQFLGKIMKVNTRDVDAIVIDEIAESFYPIDPKTGLPLSSGSWIDLQGNPVGGRQAEAQGQVICDANGNWSIQWKQANVEKSNLNGQSPGDGWHGRFYVKAKEDFIGGNTIATNRDAALTLVYNGGKSNSIQYKEPNVNVRLLDLNQHESEVTVFLGDKTSEYEPAQSALSPDQLYLSPQAALYELLKQVEFTEIVGRDNASTVGAAKDYSGAAGAMTGWETSSDITITLENLKRADGSSAEILPTAQEWETLVAAANGEGGMLNLENGIPYLTKEYRYTDHDGAVGSFKYKLYKQAVEDYRSDLRDHEPQTSGRSVETYTLSVTYIPYDQGSSRATAKNPAGTNQLNGSAGPGKIVNATDNPMVLASTNRHYIHVIEGNLKLKKVLTLSSPLAEGEEKSFTFQVKRTSPEGLYACEQKYDTIRNRWERNPETARDEFNISLKLTAADLTEGSAYEYVLESQLIQGLPRGTYEIQELAALGYDIEKMEDDGSNCIFHIAEDQKSMEAVIGRYLAENPQNAGSQIEKNAITAENLVYGQDGAFLGQGAAARVSIHNQEAVLQTDFELVKRSSIADNTRLMGAQFELYKAGASPEIVSEEKVSAYIQADEIGKPAGEQTDTFITGEDGRVHIYGLEFHESGTAVYYLKESLAPAGYQMLDAVIRIEVAYSGDGKDQMTFTYGKTSREVREGAETEIWYPVSDSEVFHISQRMLLNEDGNAGTNDITIKDPPLYSLPSAGSRGILPFVLVGTLLMMAATMINIKARRDI